MMAGVGRAVKVVIGAGCAGAGGWWLSNKYGQLAGPPVDGALQPGKGLLCKLREVEQLTHDTSRFRFDLPTCSHVLGLRTASHILAVDNSMVARAYTPTTLDKFDKGYFDLVVKKYPNGYFSKWFHQLSVGDKMEFRGPVYGAPLTLY